MTTLAETEIRRRTEVATDVPLGRVEAELTRQFKAIQVDFEAPVQLVRMSNLIIFCNDTDQTCRAESVVPAVVESHPARVLLLHADPSRSSEEITASVLVRQLDSHRLASELVV